MWKQVEQNTEDVVIRMRKIQTPALCLLPELSLARSWGRFQTLDQSGEIDLMGQTKCSALHIDIINPSFQLYKNRTSPSGGKETIHCTRGDLLCSRFLRTMANLKAVSGSQAKKSHHIFTESCLLHSVCVGTLAYESLWWI